MRSAGLPGLADLTELLVSELVTNAVVHAGTPCELRIRPDGDGVHVEVRDRDPSLPSRNGHPDPMATSGRGVALVRDLADEFGMGPVSSGGKAVWFFLRRPRSTG